MLLLLLPLLLLPTAPPLLLQSQPTLQPPLKNSWQTYGNALNVTDMRPHDVRHLDRHCGG